MCALSKEYHTLSTQEDQRSLFLPRAALYRRWDVRRGCITAMIRRGDLPRPIRLAGRDVWPLAEVEAAESAWITNRTTARAACLRTG